MEEGGHLGYKKKCFYGFPQDPYNSEYSEREVQIFGKTKGNLEKKYFLKERLTKSFNTSHIIEIFKLKSVLLLICLCI